ncbi:MAG: ABC transporter permease [Spirochaetia bacterium]|jgi:tungstate transport system permease protein|nr:ABC transporter permease [Spirochaetia bacterium]
MVIVKALALIFNADREVIFISITSLSLALTSTIISTIPALFLGTTLSIKNFPGKSLIIIILNSLMAMPTVVIGLIIYSLISRSGPLGVYGLLFTPWAIIIGQSVLSFPIIASLIYSALSNISIELPETLETLGAGRFRKLYMIFRESKIAVLSAILSGFGRVIGEVGVSMMLGGNIRWYTRTITTTIALETSKGEFELAMALGIILIFISFTVNALLHMGIHNHE